MKKHFYLSPFFLMLAFIFLSCDSNTGPAASDNYEISSEPITLEINTSPDSLQLEHSPSYSIDYSELKLNGINLMSVRYYYPAPKYNIEIDREFVTAAHDSFAVEIMNCNSKYKWLMDLGIIEIDEYHGWINTEAVLLRTEKSANADSTLNYRFVFQTLKEGKGYICFIEIDSLGIASSNESHGLLIGYSINPLNKIILQVGEIKWNYNIKEGTFSTVSVSIKGTTNIYRMRGMTHGDGIISAMEIPIQNDGGFDTVIPVAFSHVEGVTLKTSSELLLYGTVGLPKIVSLKNPESNN